MDGNVEPFAGEFHLLDIYYYISTYNAIKVQKSGTLSNKMDQ